MKKIYFNEKLKMNGTNDEKVCIALNVICKFLQIYVLINVKI